ncbi:putative peptidoglycan binding protein [Paucimonas lemoignei]|uniref:Putative peptidoglycan binding protein n=1 Tax=Paucimonas lemoignei TaxID=29443 RepID=A0A4V2UIU7_PAULE|nr:glycosyl hydrolase 108 family protein [Paucimonas lemoignei]TCS37500.1 putative peptidoglycan binding protein [Paucimonas lemoignei]
MKFEEKLDELVGVEGGYVNDPADSGGETIWGITAAVARAFGYAGAMKDMTKAQAKEIYRARYWTQPKFDQVGRLSAPIAYELFDTGVNMGQTVAGKFLQRALNVLNNGATIFPDLTVDGAIGKMTLYALETYLKARGVTGENTLLKMLNAQQSVRYLELAESRPKDERFMFGWQTNRVEM